jgi:hypothetical protein
MNNTPRTLQEFPLGMLQDPAIDKRIPATGLEELHVTAQTLGNLMICFDVEDEARVIAAGEIGLLPQRIEREDGTLYMEGASLRDYVRHGQNQKILIEVHVPVQTRVHVEMFAGVVILNGGEGDVTIQGRFGEVAGVTNTRSLRAHLKAGDVTLYELHGMADIQVSLGSVTLQWSELDGSEQINVRCGLAGVDLHLPPGIAPVEDLGGMFKQKTVETPQGTRIHAQIGFGGLDVLEWSADIADDRIRPEAS